VIAVASVRAKAAVAHRRGLSLTLCSVRENLPFVTTYEMVLDALGDRTRRQIVQVLRGGPVAVGELSTRIPVSRPAISQHLKVLQACQLVDYESVGTRHLYRLDPTGVRELRAWLDDFWDGALGQFARYAAEQAALESSPVPGGDVPEGDEA
jgi:DNA-binding transcriptional ArsR family regulator